MDASRLIRYDADDSAAQAEIARMAAREGRLGVCEDDEDDVCEEYPQLVPRPAWSFDDEGREALEQALELFGEEPPAHLIEQAQAAASIAMEVTADDMSWRQAARLEMPRPPSWEPGGHVFLRLPEAAWERVGDAAWGASVEAALRLLRQRR